MKGFKSKRQRSRTAMRRLHGNPWDSSSSSSKRNVTSRRVTFRNPIVRSKSSKSSSHAAWRSVSSKK